MALLAQEGATARIVRIARPENRAAFGDSADQGQNVPLNSEIAQRFLQLDFNGFGRVGRYEAALWRQVYQVIFVLDVLRRQNNRTWLSRSLAFRQSLDLNSPPEISTL